MKGTILENCPFCGRQAIAKNDQGIAVCVSHKDTELVLKCFCGEPLDILNGKYGIFCNCLRCGNMSLKKAIEINDIEKPMPTLPKENKVERVIEKTEKPKDITIRSDDPDYFD